MKIMELNETKKNWLINLNQQRCQNFIRISSLLENLMIILQNNQ